MVLASRLFTADSPDIPSCPGGWAGWEAVMDTAMEQARMAEARGETPVGAVLLDASGEYLAAAGNASIGSHDPSGHAEIATLRLGCARAGNYRLPGSILAVTLEPCLMCLGALVQARVGVVVFGARDPKAGVLVSRLDGVSLPFLNHRFDVIEGVRGEECGELLTRFFRERRGR